MEWRGAKRRRGRQLGSTIGRRCRVLYVMPENSAECCGAVQVARTAHNDEMMMLVVMVVMQPTGFGYLEGH